MDKFYRFIWEYEGGYTANITHEHANAWMTHLAQQNVSPAHKCNCQKSLKMLFKWRTHEHGHAEWEPKFTFTQESSSNPREYLTREERAAIREAALEYDSVPGYNNLTPAARDRWKTHLS